MMTIPEAQVGEEGAIVLIARLPLQSFIKFIKFGDDIS